LTVNVFPFANPMLALAKVVLSLTVSVLLFVRANVPVVVFTVKPLYVAPVIAPELMLIPLMVLLVAAVIFPLLPT